MFSSFAQLLTACIPYSGCFPDFCLGKIVRLPFARILYMHHAVAGFACCDHGLSTSWLVRTVSWVMSGIEPSWLLRLRLLNLHITLWRWKVSFNRVGFRAEHLLRCVVVELVRWCLVVDRWVHLFHLWHRLHRWFFECSLHEFVSHFLQVAELVNHVLHDLVEMLIEICELINSVCETSATRISAGSMLV